MRIPLPAAGGQVPDVVAPPPGNPRFPLADSIRALAALAILVVHTALFSGVSKSWYWPLLAHLDIGVPIFFLLSGCLLYRPMLSARVLGTPATPHAIYALRRFLRILPAYWLALTLLAIVPGLAGVFGSNWSVYYGLLQNYPVYTQSADCVASPFLCGIAPTWTLALEVAFYIALPFFALAMRWLSSRLPNMSWLVLELAALGIASAISVAIQGGGSFHGLHLWLFFSPLGRAWWFGLGMGLAVVSVWLQQRGRLAHTTRWMSDHSGVLWATAVLLYVLPAYFVFKAQPLLAFPLEIGRSEYVASYLLAGVIGALLLLPVVFWDGRDGLAKRLLANSVLAWLGRISYGIFLWHYPIMHRLREAGAGAWWPGMTFPVVLTGTLALTVVCSALSYSLLERPLMRLKYRR
jgi:peptidoglycan/LPS O-acetylase OafA/YrhL